MPPSPISASFLPPIFLVAKPHIMAAIPSGTPSRGINERPPRTNAPDCNFPVPELLSSFVIIFIVAELPSRDIFWHLGERRSLPLDRPGRLRGHVVDDAIDAFDFVDDAGGDRADELHIERIEIRR